MKHTGSCHCGIVKFEVEMKIESVLECNCTYCSKKGTLLAFTTPQNFTVTQGKDNLTTYLWNKKVIQHEFCKSCGVQPYAHAQTPNGPGVAINVRCLDVLDWRTLPVQNFDGLHLL
jgi:hypothetical protein